MKCNALLSFILLLAQYHLSHAQTIEQKLQTYFTGYHTEKVYANHDKPFYVPGERIWCKIYLLDGSSHQAFNAQPIVYADWVTPYGSIAESYTLQIKDGSATLDIQTWPSDTTGIYTLRVYSQYQRNFDAHFLFQKEIRLLDKFDFEQPDDDDADFSIRFYPEGGHLVAGLESRIAFKVQNASGKNISVRGVLMDQAQEEIVRFQTLHEGMGFFKLIPQAGVSYQVKASYQGREKSFPLPPILQRGYVLTANSRFTDHIRLSIETNQPDFLSACTLIGHIRGQVFLNQTLAEQQQQKFSLKKSNLPSGILHFTLFDPQQRPVCERLVFNNNPTEAVEVALDLEKEMYGQRELVQLELATQLEGRTVPANLSISVYNDELTQLGPNSLNIKNYLWLQSDLKGRINNIQQYFEANDARTNSLLDVLLLTHGWRRFSWQDVLMDQKPGLVYPPEEHISIAGKVTKLGQDKPIKADIMLNVLSEEQFASLSVTTDEDGLFYFKGFDFSDTTDILIQANKHQPKKKNKQKAGEIKRVGSKYVDIQLFDLNDFPFIDSTSFPSQSFRVEKLQQYAAKIEEFQQVDSTNNPLWSIDLATVTVRSGLNRAQLREQEIQKRYKEKGLFYFYSTEKYLTDDPLYDDFQKKDIFELIKTVVPRATRVRSNGRQKIIYGRFSGQKEALIVLDGDIVPLDFLEAIDPADIAVIDVLQGLYASLYGGDLVIALTSKNPGERKKPNLGVITLSHPGYYSARTFYSPNYALAEQSQEKSDYRTTLYWNPEIRLKQRHEKVEFYTGDLPGTYLISIEGITDSGLPFVKSERIVVQF